MVEEEGTLAFHHSVPQKIVGCIEPDDQMTPKRRRTQERLRRAHLRMANTKRNPMPTAPRWPDDVPAVFFFGAAGGRLPIRHGVGGFAIKLIHSSRALTENDL